MSEDLHRYLVEHGTPPDAILQELTDETVARVGGMSVMQIAPEQGAFMTLLAKLIGAKRAIEVGTFTGYSALCIARGLAADGQLICCDVSEEWTSIGRPFWEKAGVADRIDLRIGPALETLRSLPEERSFDLAFIDADKPEYPDYYEEVLKRIRSGGVILVDNVLWGGSVADASNQADNTNAIRAFNDLVARDDRVDSVMLPLSDGLTLIRVP
ncbi:MAG: class I SAM-dependent methyltransferase [Myxococcota bacterium]|nr:class I SAM-dependent methyltransferase [Myxococcota bacterium]